MKTNLPVVIIAAGSGSRLEKLHQNKPKTLLPLFSNHRIIDQILFSFQEAGLDEFIIVTGFQHHILEQELHQEKYSHLKIDLVHNPHWQKPNGISVLAAESAVKGRNFILSMSDHLFELSAIETLVNYEINPGEVVVAIDRNISNLHDVDDAMKLKTIQETNRTRILEMDKNLQDYDSVDCGLFKCTPGLFDALWSASSRGLQALSHGGNILARQRKMFGCEITGNFWIDIDTSSALKVARKHFNSKH